MFNFKVWYWFCIINYLDLGQNGLSSFGKASSLGKGKTLSSKTSSGVFNLVLTTPIPSCIAPCSSLKQHHYHEVGRSAARATAGLLCKLTYACAKIQAQTYCLTILTGLIT